MTKTQMTVLRFGARPVPPGLADLPVGRVEEPAEIGPALEHAGRDAGRIAVVGSDADLAAVLTHLLRTDRLDIEVAHIRGRRGGWRSAAGARTAAARRVPLIRDDTGTVVAGSALWLPPEGSTVMVGEAVADDAVLFDGEASGVRIEPTTALPGVRAAVIGRRRGLTGRRWLAARAVQLGTTGAQVVRDGIPGAREVRRSTFYRHTTGWLQVR